MDKYGSKKTIAIIMVLSLLMAVIFSFNVSAEDNTSDFILNQDISITNYNELINYLSPNPQTPDYFDDYFAGGSIDENGNLIIYIKGTEDTAHTIFDSYTAVMSTPNKVSYKTVNYSLHLFLL